MSNRHYSSSKPVQWLRKKVFKIDKPVALGWGEWEKWDANLKATRPFANFVTETLPDWIEKIPETFLDPIYNVRYNIQNRLDGSHCLKSTLQKGKYYEFSKRMLHSNFDSFADFIECEEAWSHIAWADKEDKLKYKLPWHHQYRILRWFGRWRCPQAGIDHLKWEMTLDTPPDPPDPNWMASPEQARMAYEKMAIYTWWRHIRPTRGDAWEESGMRKFWDEMDAKYNEDGKTGSWLSLSAKSKLNAAESRRYSALNKLTDEIEAQWEEEDEAMLIRLVKIRNFLWT